MIGQLINTLLGIGLGLVIFMFLAYLVYIIGLAKVFKQLDIPGWKALIPGYNFYVLIQAMGAPKRWFIVSLVPYIGAVYSLAIALRLGKMFGRGVIFSATWLTIGAPVGIWVIARQDGKPDFQVLTEPPLLISRKQHKANLAAAKVAQKKS